MTTELSEVARSAVLHQLAQAHDHWSEEEQRVSGTEQTDAWQVAHDNAVRLLRAYRIELDDPEPAPMPDAAPRAVDYWEWLRRAMGQ